MDEFLKNNDLLFFSGNDIPCAAIGVNIRQPKIKEIALLGEQNFYTALELLNFSKDSLSEEDKVNLEDISNFEILIAILEEPNAVMRKNRNCIMMVLNLIFPDFEINLANDTIQLKQNDQTFNITKDNFEAFKTIVNHMFEYRQDEEFKYDPSGPMAKKIAEKLRKRHDKLQEIKPNKDAKVDILNRYISILATAQQISLDSLFNCTVYQLFDIFKRWQLRDEYQLDVQIKLAGGKGLTKVEDWMEDIHSSTKN